MSTPEGKVKDKVKQLLAQFKPQLYAHWPVQNGMGAPTLDCVGGINGRAFAIETKAPGAKPTKRQEQTSIEMRLAGYEVFVTDGDTETFERMRAFFAYWYVRGVIERGI